MRKERAASNSMGPVLPSAVVATFAASSSSMLASAHSCMSSSMDLLVLSTVGSSTVISTVGFGVWWQLDTLPLFCRKSLVGLWLAAGIKPSGGGTHLPSSSMVSNRILFAVFLLLRLLVLSLHPPLVLLLPLLGCCRSGRLVVSLLSVGITPASRPRQFGPCDTYCAIPGVILLMIRFTRGVGGCQLCCLRHPSTHFPKRNDLPQWLA